MYYVVKSNRPLHSGCVEQTAMYARWRAFQKAYCEDLARRSTDDLDDIEFGARRFLLQRVRSMT
jgi:hypothetical protein